MTPNQQEPDASHDIDIDELISQLSELSHTRLRSRSEQLRQQIQVQIDALLREEILEEGIVYEPTNLIAA